MRDRETKQVQFMRANGIPARRLYVYDGVKLVGNQGYSDLRQVPQYGTESNPHVWVMREFKNSEANQLGMPLPQGRLRFYRRGEDGQLEFTGENERLRCEIIRKKRPRCMWWSICTAGIIGQ
jgi:hypothetical protein